MANVYEVRHSNGQTYDVTTDRHHDDHHEDDFKAILLNIVERSAGTAIGGVVLHFILKGRR
ncbi:MAG: hypothetical protein GC184_13710 [Rhizobiales bacterium]|nr:hypothetical protein [Hyphomicrobiales bacterium]